MAERYVLKFSKGGYAKYTSHLDLLRFFKRAFRKTGIDLRYSQGFNPHPKLGFAQPLSLGYSGAEELLEFETNIYNEPEDIMELLKPEMPEGLEIKWCGHFDSKIKSLAGEAESADYRVTIPFKISQEELERIIDSYMAQDKITAMKRRKKDKKMVEVPDVVLYHTACKDMTFVSHKVFKQGEFLGRKGDIFVSSHYSMGRDV